MEVVALDLNGTLLDDGPITWGGVLKIFEHHEKTPPTLEEYFQELDNDNGYLNIYRSRGIDVPLDALNVVFQEHYKNNLHAIQPTPGAKKVLGTLQKRLYKLHLLTMQPSDLGIMMLERHELLEHFYWTEFYSFNKTKVLKKFMKAAGASYHECCMIGDAPSDIAAANKAGVVSIAYLNGFTPKELVLAENPQYTINHLEELLTLMK